MKYTFTEKGIFKDKEITVDLHTDSLSVSEENGEALTGRLMRICLENGSSVIVYSQKDYYRYVHDIAPSYIASISYKEIISDCTVPYIIDTAATAEKEVEQCFEEYGMENKFSYMKSKIDGQRFYDPQKYKSFYQIKKGNTTKEMFFTESLLANIVAQCLYTEPLHEVVLFLAMPYRPVTERTLSLLQLAQKGYINVVCLEKALEASESKYTLYTDGKIIALKAPNRSFKVKNAELYPK